jgi:glycosyltransferase involved in cell wall biosynthesis
VFSIIIPTFNSSQTIKNCLESILSQSFRNFEIVVMDAGSSDDTLSVIQSFKDLRIRIHSESDNGVYDAMNKGIDKAQGEWLLFLGSDDTLHDVNVLGNIAFVLKSTRKYVVYGDAKVEGDVSWAKGEQVYGGKFTLYRLLRRNICHQAIFYKKKFLQQNQLKYNLNYPISADWDLNLRAWMIKPFQYFPGVISNFSAGGISSNGGADKFNELIPIIYDDYYYLPYLNPLKRFLFSIILNLRNITSK